MCRKNTINGVGGEELHRWLVPLQAFRVMHGEDGGEVNAEEIIAYCRERLGAYKYPREIRFVTELPKGSSGKILKSALRDG